MIPLDKLKTDYKSFESKKHLSAYYDVYLADRRIYHLLPRHLGKSFFIKKRWAPFEVAHVIVCATAAFVTVFGAYCVHFVWQVPISS